MSRHNYRAVECGFSLRTIVIVMFSWMVASRVAAEDVRPILLHRVTFTDDKSKTRTVEACVLLTAQDGGLLLEGRDGRLWTVSPKQLENDEETTDPFIPLTADEIGKQLQQELLEPMLLLYVLSVIHLSIHVQLSQPRILNEVKQHIPVG